MTTPDIRPRPSLGSRISSRGGTPPPKQGAPSEPGVELLLEEQQRRNSDLIIQSSTVQNLGWVLANGWTGAQNPAEPLASCSSSSGEQQCPQWTPTNTLPPPLFLFLLLPLYILLFVPLHSFFSFLPTIPISSPLLPLLPTALPCRLPLPPASLSCHLSSFSSFSTSLSSSLASPHLVFTPFSPLSRLFLLLLPLLLQPSCHATPPPLCPASPCFSSTAAAQAVNTETLHELCSSVEQVTANSLLGDLPLLLLLLLSSGGGPQLHYLLLLRSIRLLRRPSSALQPKASQRQLSDDNLE